MITKKLIHSSKVRKYTNPGVKLSATLNKETKSLLEQCEELLETCNEERGGEGDDGGEYDEGLINGTGPLDLFTTEQYFYGDPDEEESPTVNFNTGVESVFDTRRFLMDTSYVPGTHGEAQIQNGEASLTAASGTFTYRLDSTNGVDLSKTREIRFTVISINPDTEFFRIGIDGVGGNYLNYFGTPSEGDEVIIDIYPTTFDFSVCKWITLRFASSDINSEGIVIGPITAAG